MNGNVALEIRCRRAAIPMKRNRSGDWIELALEMTH
jgi:hypothetical protein